MRIKMDGHLVEPLDPDVDATSQKKNKKKQTGSEQPSQKRPRFESDPKDGKEGNLPSTVEISRKGKEKVTESSDLLNVDIDVDIAAEERRMLKIGVKANRLEMDPPLSIPTRQTSGRGNNHIPIGDTTKEVPPTSSKLPFDGIMEESVSQMTAILSNILEHHGCVNQCLASLEKDLVHSKREEKKLKATIEALEKEKSEMNAKVALMERKDLYKLLEAKMEGFQIANHPGTIGGFENLNLTITRKWMEIPALNLEEFEKCPAYYPEKRERRHVGSHWQADRSRARWKPGGGKCPETTDFGDYMQRKIKKKKQTNKRPTSQAARSEQDFEEKPDMAEDAKDEKEDANDEKGDANDRRARSKQRRQNGRKLKLACNEEKCEVL
ncbi:hypothetical protein R1flu_027134 [Riccia fluitans]|uniref:Uncharacterized protein n=1 Tax=Riccia fluitans TaxID=41844 RepID=A0ABD1XKZ6_9MARC